MCFHPAENVQSQQLNPANHPAVNSRLLVRRQRNTASERAAANTLKRVDDTRQITDAGDRELQTQPGTEDNDGPSRRACTVPSEEQSASALAVTDHARALSPSDQTCCSIGNCMQLVCDFFGRQTKTTLQ